MESFKDRKPSFRRKVAPVVRQTKTSIYRTLKANPLMLCDEEDMKKIGVHDISKIPKSVDVLGIVKSDESKLKLIHSDAAITHDQKSVKFTTNNIPSTNTNVNNKIVQTKNEIKKHAPTVQKQQTTAKSLVRQTISSRHRNKIIHPRIRRSKSAEKFDPTKCVPKGQPLNHDRSMSMHNINKKILENNHSPIRRNDQEVIFKTPIAYNRRSVTPMTSFQSTPAPHDLQNRLNEWLIKTGKSINNFHHLKCFGLHKMKEVLEDVELTEDKENIETETLPHIKNNPINYNLIARNALDDLHKLIEDGYPINLCETWLGRIREKYSQLEEEPLYWECRAALEQARGNITTAVDHYRQAIVQGAEVHTIEESLDHLLEKFSLLHIDASTENTKSNRIILDARNAFKSTIIKFAVQERKLKKKGEDDQKQQLVITPVRRSTRLSLIPTNTTPGIKLCNSLKEMDMNENMKFQKNCYL